MTDATQAYETQHLLNLAYDACHMAGAGEAMSGSLARAFLSADLVGRHEVGIAHMFDYLTALRSGRINGAANPRLDAVAPAILRVDCDSGVMQMAFDGVFDELLTRSGAVGACICSFHNGFPVGELGYFVRRLAETSLLSIAATNASAMLSPKSGMAKVFSTNPLAFGAPLARGAAPLIIDQASSATAYVNVVRAAAHGIPLQPGWATDDRGQPTIDPLAALQGALLPFGGYKGANVALVVEVLAAGLSGANWSLDAAHFSQGGERPGNGMTIIVLDPSKLSENFTARLTDFLERIAGMGAHVPGSGAPRLPLENHDAVTIETTTYQRLLEAAGH